MSLASHADGALAGRHVVVTRPAGQAQALADAIMLHGGTPVLFPVLAIFDIADPQTLVAVSDRLHDFDLAVFISANAVSKALTVVLARRNWPSRLRVAAMGKSSEHALQQFGITEVIAPHSRFDSEALLALPELAPGHVRGKRVLIFRGDGGRELLGETLAARGARVEYVQCYRRARPSGDAGLLIALWTRAELDAITVTSSEGLRNLFDMVGESARSSLTETPLFVPHERIAQQAQHLGCDRVVLTGAGDEGLIAGLIRYFSAG